MYNDHKFDIVIAQLVYTLEQPRVALATLTTPKPVDSNSVIAAIAPSLLPRPRNLWALFRDEKSNTLPGNRRMYLPVSLV